MREKHREIRFLLTLERADDASEFLIDIPDADFTVNQVLLLDFACNTLCEKADEADRDAAPLDVDPGPENGPVQFAYRQICADNRKIGAFFQKQKMRETVIDFVIADRKDIRRERIC